MDRSELAAAVHPETERDRLLRDAIERARRGTFYRRHLSGHTLSRRDDLEQLLLTFKRDLS